MTRQETMMTRFGEMRDMITCLQIDRGELIPKESKSSKKPMTYQEAISLE